MMGGIETSDGTWQTNSKLELFFNFETLLPLWECIPSHHIALDSVGNTDILPTFPSTPTLPTASRQ